MVKILLVGGMVNTLNAFRPLADELRKRGHEVTLLEGTNTPSSAQLEELRGADLVFSGMAAPAEHAALELGLLAVAKDGGKPYGLLSDAAGAFKGRPWFDAFKAGAAFLATRFEREVELAQKLYPRARVAAVGHPTIETAAFPKFSRDEVRQKLGLKEDAFAVYLSGTKSPETNKEIITLVDFALARGHVDLSRPRFVFLLGPHPGVTGEKARAAGKEIPFEAYRRLSARLEVVEPSLGKAEELMIAMDVFLFTSGTTFYAAIYQGVPAVLLNSPVIAGSRDTDLSFECGAGLVFVANSHSALRQVFEILLWKAGREFLRANREVYLEKPEPPGTSVKKMADLVESVLNR